MEIAVPSAAVGAIIGKGGATISALQQESGAIIRVTQQTEGDSRIILLSG
ncbi:MAG: KH domain-containing protein, partial [Alcanivorax sp.]